MPKFKSERTTIYHPHKGVRIDIDGEYETTDKAEVAALRATDGVEEVKPPKKKSDDS